MRPSAVMLLIVGVLAAAGCNEPMDVLVGDDDPTMADGRPIEIHADCSLLDLESDPAIVQKVEISGDLLTISIEYAGGCAAHTITLHAGRCFLESWPPQSDIFLVHDDVDDPCDAVIAEERVFDLVPLKDAYRDQHGRSRTLVLNVYHPDILQAYLPKPLYDVGSD